MVNDGSLAVELFNPNSRTEGCIATPETEFSRYIWWRGVHRAKSCGCAYGGQTTMVQEAMVNDGLLAIELCCLFLSREPKDAHS